MDPLSALEARDGTATFGELMSDGVHPTRLALAVEAGSLARAHRGVYVLPDAYAPFAAAKRLGGTVSHTSAAGFHALDLLTEPEVHHVTVPRERRKERRFGYEHVMGMPAFFTSTLAMALEVGSLRRAPQCVRCGRAVLAPAAWSGTGRRSTVVG